MKHKFSSMGRVAIALVLALSLSLVMAVPAAADTPADTDVGFEFVAGASWSDAKTDETDAMGSYSVELAASGDYVQFVPQAGIKFSDLADITASPEWSFWYYSGGIGPGLELRFTGPESDPAAAGPPSHVDITVNTAELDPETGKWYQEEITSSSTATCYGNDSEATGATDYFFDGTWGPGTSTGNLTLAQLVSAVNALFAGAGGEWDGSDPADWELTRVRAEIYASETVYIDDITIAGVTYELEPIFLDEDAYNVGATVEVTVPNSFANTDPIRKNPITGEPPVTDGLANWSVTATSTSDTSGITVDLEETGINTGVFTGEFATTGTTPAGEDELYVEDDDIITVTYGKIGAMADWGAGDSETSVTAGVDVTAPTISDLSPPDGDTISVRTPDIGATYDTVPTTSVELIFDGVDVTDDATVGTTSVSYTPEDDLDDGTYEVTLNIEDAAGNPATETWSFSIASWLDGSPVSSDPNAVSILDELDTVDLGLAVTITGDEGIITVGRYASNPQPEAPPAFDMIEDGFFDVKVTNLVAGTASQIVIKFADTAITAESTAYVWDDLQGMWLACSDQGYNPTDEFLWVKVRVADTTPNISELSGTPFAISGVEEVEEDISAYYRAYSGDAEVVETTDLLKAANDWADEVVPSGFTESISTTELLALANEWAATE